MKLISMAEMQAVEDEANQKGLTYEMMMENAGRGLAEVVADFYGYLTDEGVCGLVGSGNNGGDTLVALTYLAQQEWPASAYLVRPRPEDDPLITRLLNAGGKLFRVEEDPSYTQLSELLHSHAVLLDGVLGTGVRLPLKPELGSILKTIQQILAALEDPPCVVAVDCPSGIDCDSGEAAAECLTAERTVTMAAVKYGLLRFPAYELVGDIQVVEIGLPQQMENLLAWRQVTRRVADFEWVREIIPSRPVNAHKGTFGTALVVAGSVNYTGAAWLAGQAAYRIGAGLVTLAVPAPLHTPLAGQFPEATWVLLPDEIGVIAADAAEIVRESFERATALLIGPGFGLETSTGEFLNRLLTSPTQPAPGRIGFARMAPESVQAKPDHLPPLVIDADGLKLLARLPDWPALLPGTAVLTPHPGEMAVLTQLSRDEIQAERLLTAERFSRIWGHVVVLKGAMTIIAAPDGQTAIIPVASPALARAGTGDVLAGLIVGLRAQGVEAYLAAVAAAWIHAQAGIKAALAVGNPASVIAGDVLRSVIDVMNDLQ